MRFYNIFRYDFRYGFLSRPGKWTAVVLYGVFLFISFSFSLFHGFYGEVEGLWDINSLSLSTGDVFMADLGGKLPPDFQQLQSYSFPTTWFMWDILPCVLTLSYMSEDLSQGGMQVLVRARKKTWWWFSKCLWNLWVVLVYYGLGYLTLWLLSFASGKAQTWELNPRIFQFQFAQSLPASHSTSLFVSVCLLPCLVGMAVNLMQMTLTLFVKPIFAFVAACCYCIIGIYYAHPLMLSNYAMPVRSADIGIYNFQPTLGAFLCILAWVGCFLVGAWKIRRQDIVGLTP